MTTEKHAETATSDHYATTNYFVIECACGCTFSELTEERARQQFEQHHVAALFENGRVRPEEGR